MTKPHTDSVLIPIVVILIIIFSLYMSYIYEPTLPTSLISYTDKQIEVIKKEPTPEEIEAKTLYNLPLNSQMIIQEFKVTSVPGGWIYDKEGFQPIFIKENQWRYRND